MREKILASVAAAAVTLGALGAPAVRPAHAGSQDSSPTLDRIMKHKRLVVGMTAEQPPLNMKNKKGEIIGLDADLARLLANGMGVDLKIVTKPFKDLLPAVARGDVDMAISGITITPERNMKVAFVGPYFVSGKSILTKSKTLKALESIEEINKPGFTFAALSGSTSEIFVQELLPKATLKATKDYAEATKLVRDGSADALVADLPYCVFAGLRDPDKELDALSDPLTFEPLGIALPPGDALLVNLVQNVIATLDGTGALEKIAKRWFEDESWLSEVP